MTPTEMLARLVAFPSVSRDGNRALVDWVREWLAAQGIAATVQTDETGAKANLWATLGPNVPGGVVLSGHTDVVPVDGQAWSSDPFALVERDGRLYGRGACDMKGFVALCLALAPAMRDAGLRRPIHLALSYDEELGYAGARRMVPALREALAPPAAVLVGEPTGLRVVSQHKGGLGMTTTVRGFAVHSSILHRGVSAIAEAARLIEWHRTAMEAEAAAADPACPFDPPYTTLHVGIVEGGIAANITAERCRFVSDVRPLPEQRPEDWRDRYLAVVAEAEARMKAIHPDCGIDVTERFLGEPCRPEPGGAAEALARGLTGDNGVSVVSYGTEAGVFQDAGWSTVVVGPGDIAQAHQPDEFITRAQFEAGEAFLRRLIDRLAA